MSAFVPMAACVSMAMTHTLVAMQRELYRLIGQTSANQATIALVFSDSRSVALTTFSRSIPFIGGDGNSAIVAEELYGQRTARP